MKNVRKSPYSLKWYLIVGVFYLCLGVFILWRNYYFSVSDYSIFWLCDFAPFILAIGFLFRHDDFVKGMINIGFFPQILFLFGAFMMFFFGVDVFGVGLSLEHLSFWFILTSIVLHLSLIAAYFLNYEVKPTYKSLIYSLLLLFVMYFIAISHTPIEENVNYVFILDNLGIMGFTYMYIPFVFLVIVFPTFVFQILMQKLWFLNHRNKE